MEFPNPRDFADMGAWKRAMVVALDPTTIDIEPEKRTRKPVSQWTIKETAQALFAMAILGIVVPFVLLFGSLAVLAIWDSFFK